MHTPSLDIGMADLRTQSRTRFCWVFKRKFRQLLFQHGSAAEGFGAVWQETLDQVPLQEHDQCEVYWELIGWAKAASYSPCVGRSRCGRRLGRDSKRATSG
jgi:hypothetical protein